MNFIIIFKKEGFTEEHINNDWLSNNTAPTLISEKNHRMEIANTIVYTYLYNHVYEEKEGYSYYCDSNNILYMINGIVNIENQQYNDIIDFFERERERGLTDGNNLIGDYQIVSIDKKGNGFIKTPPYSHKQLFFYEDELCSVFATEIKLIVDGISKFQEKSFAYNYDLDFIEDSVFREWIHRKFPRNTIFKSIKRVFPFDDKYFEEGKIVIDKKDEIVIPEDFKREFKNNRQSLFDSYYKELIKFTQENFKFFKDNLSKVTLALSGGYDSRLALSIYYKICNENNIPLECITTGDTNHPDLVIAKKIGKSLNLKHEFNIPPSGKKERNIKTISEYMKNFFFAQGDYNSNDPRFNNRKIQYNQLTLAGLDAFKRYNINLLINGNRWFARRMLSANNFLFPLFNTKYEVYFAFLYGSEYREFIYEVLKRANTELLKIPAVGDSLPKNDVEPYSSTSASKFHAKEPFLWDYQYVNKNLKPAFDEYLNNIGFPLNILFKIFGFNGLDIFFNKEIVEIIDRKNKISLKEAIKKILKIKKYKLPKKKCFVEVKNPEDLVIKRRMLILMDFASVADLRSFHDIEKLFESENR